MSEEEGSSSCCPQERNKLKEQPLFGRLSFTVSGDGGCSEICIMLFLLTFFLAKVNHIDMPKCSEGGRHSIQSHGLGKSPDAISGTTWQNQPKIQVNCFDLVIPFLVTYRMAQACCSFLSKKVRKVTRKVFD